MESFLTETAPVIATSFAACAVLTVLTPAAWTIDTRSRVTSTVHAFLATGLSLYVLAIMAQEPNGAGNLLLPGADAVAPDRIWFDTHPLAHLSCCITLGYIAFDTALGASFPELLDVPMWVHHTLVLLAYGLGVIADVSVNYLALFLINEASTPFVNLFFVTRNEWKDWRKAANGFAMWLSYLVCRLAINTVYAVSMYNTATPKLVHEYPVIVGLHIFSFMGAQLLNLNWFYRITKGLIKEVRKALCAPKKHSS